MSFLFHESDAGAIVLDHGIPLTIEHAAAFQTFLNDRLQSGATIHLSLMPDQEVDLTGLQLLCSACRSASDLGGQLVLQGALPASLAQLVEAAGITRHTVCKNNGGRACSWFGGTP